MSCIEYFNDQAGDDAFEDMAFFLMTGSTPFWARDAHNDFTKELSKQ